MQRLLIIFCIVLICTSVSGQIIIRDGPPDWEANPYMQYNMQIIALLQYDNGQISLNDNDMVGAFVGNECRGVMAPNPNHNGIIFLTVGSNQLSGEIVTFKAYLADEDEVVELNQAIVFENQLQTGSVSDPFLFNHHITGPPDWEPEPYMLYNMQIIGQLQHEDGTISLNPEDIVGAFYGEECRGVMSPDPAHNGLIFMTVGSNLDAGEVITFKAYLAGMDVTVHLNQSLVFENMLQTGTVANPFSFTYHDEIPDELWLCDILIAAGEQVCYEAGETIILAGDDTWFTAEADSEVFLAAGETIIMRPGTHLQAGSYVHAFIDEEGGFCFTEQSVVVNNIRIQHGTKGDEQGLYEPLFEAYPNPTTGIVWLEIADHNVSNTYRLSVFGITGTRFMERELTGASLYMLDLSDLPGGMYLLRVSNSYYEHTRRIIRH